MTACQRFLSNIEDIIGVKERLLTQNVQNHLDNRTEEGHNGDDQCLQQYEQYDIGNMRGSRYDRNIRVLISYYRDM